MTGVVDAIGSAFVSASFDRNERFVLDIRVFSSIIYIWYEGGGLRPLLVER